MRKKSPVALFRDKLTLEYLGNIFEHKLSWKKNSGIDGLTPENFSTQKETHFKVIIDKCLNKTYNFSPYYELLQSKGREDLPRRISLPVVRDRLVLLLLKEMLHETFPEYVNRRLPNNYLKDLKTIYASHDYKKVYYHKVDIKKFYDSIDHQKLFNNLKEIIKSEKLMKLIRMAVQNPTVTKDFKRKYLKDKRNPLGVPQGLAISNILADIYLRNFDKAFEGKHIKYLRYVDDILIFVSNKNRENLKKKLDLELKKLNLELNRKKTTKGSYRKPFEYLGYRIRFYKKPSVNNIIVSIKLSTVDKFIRKIASKFSAYKHKSGIWHTKFQHLNDECKRKIFISELNLKITGAVSENKKYGWIFYFLEINDLHQLHQIDAVIESFFDRLSDFKHKKPKELKKLVKAFYEANFNPNKSKYIDNYNNYDTLQKKLKYLTDRGYIDLSSERKYTPKQIEAEFESIKQRNLSELEIDVGTIY